MVVIFPKIHHFRAAAKPSSGGGAGDVSAATRVHVVPSWPPQDDRSYSLEDTARAAAAEVAKHAATDPHAPAVQRAVAASARATASVAAAVSDAAESRRDVAEAVLTLQGIEWPARVKKAMALMDAQAAEFDAQLQHLKEKGVLPSEVQRVAVEQLLDAIGAITVTLQGLLMQVEQEVAMGGCLWTLIDLLRPELRRLPAALAALRRWGIEVPPELLLVDVDELHSIPLAATDPTAVTEVRATVQRVIGALVGFGSEATLQHVARGVYFNDGGYPVFPTLDSGPDDGADTISRPPPAAAGNVCARIDAALHIYTERANEATGDLVPAVLGDVAAYARAKAVAIAEPGADAAIAELAQLTKKVPQPFGPCKKKTPCTSRSVARHVTCAQSSVRFGETLTPTTGNTSIATLTLRCCLSRSSPSMSSSNHQAPSQCRTPT
jgi:hypothetical protein